MKAKIRNIVKNVIHWAFRIKKNSDSGESEVRCPVNGMTLEDYRAGKRPTRWE